MAEVNIKISENTTRYLTEVTKKLRQTLHRAATTSSLNFASWMQRTWLSGPPGLSRNSGKLHDSVQPLRAGVGSQSFSGGIKIGTVYASVHFNDRPTRIVPKGLPGGLHGQGTSYLAIPLSSTNFRGQKWKSPMSMDTPTMAVRQRTGNYVSGRGVQGKWFKPYFALKKEVIIQPITSIESITRHYRPYFRRTINKAVKEATE